MDGSIIWCIDWNPDSHRHLASLSSNRHSLKLRYITMMELSCLSVAGNEAPRAEVHKRRSFCCAAVHDVAPLGPEPAALMASIFTREKDAEEDSLSQAPVCTCSGLASPTIDSSTPPTMWGSRLPSLDRAKGRTIGAIAIKLEDVSKQFEGAATPAVTSLDLDIEEGSIVVLIGPSGCGKTTTLRMINRLIEPTSGRIDINGEDVTQRPVAELRREIGYVIQQVGLFPHQTIAANIATVPKMLGWEKQRISDRIEELADLVGLEPSLLDRYPDELSGGQQQRVGVARALAADPPVLLMDEPFGAVDPIVRIRLQDELLELQARVGKTIVLVTHDIDEALKIADRIALLNVGGILEQYSSPDELLAEPANRFVEEFVGEDRSVKRLQLRTVADLPFNRGPVVAATDGAAAARSIMEEYATEWVGVTSRGRVPRVDPCRRSPGQRVARIRAAIRSGCASATGEHIAQRHADHHDIAYVDGRHRGRRAVWRNRHPGADPRQPRGGAGSMIPLLAQAPNPIVRWEYFIDEWDQIQRALIEHLELTVYAVVLGLVASAGLSAIALRYRWTLAPINGFTAFLYTIPSVALFGILVPYFGLSRLTAVLPLAAYTLLILVTNIVAGFNAVSPEVREAADGMGMTPTRRVLQVELPLAMPYIIAGLRIAVVSTVGIVTVAAIIGQGGLGRLILDGLRRAFWTPMTIGAALSILLALALDGLILGAGRWLTPWAQRARRAP